MTSMDINPFEAHYLDSGLARQEGLKDLRLDRDAQADLHTAIDLAYTFSAAIKGLHPLAERQVKAMIFQGNLL